MSTDTGDKGGFDLGAVASVEADEDAGQVVEIQDRDYAPLYFTNGSGEKQPVSITVAGTYSRRYRNAKNVQATRTLNRRNTQLTGEMLDANQLELTIACVIDWAGFFDAGKQIECSRENVAKTLTRAPWIRDQVEVAMGDHAGFMRES